MITSTKGLLRGRIVELEDSVPEMEGKRVRVVLEPLDEETHLSPEELSQMWREWVEHGPQGPIEDGEDTEVP